MNDYYDDTLTEDPDRPWAETWEGWDEYDYTVQ